MKSATFSLAAAALFLASFSAAATSAQQATTAPPQAGAPVGTPSALANSAGLRSSFAPSGFPRPAGIGPLSAEEQTAQAPAEGTLGQEGLKVHGHWTIDIRNPDGTLAQHREFENSLNATGGSLLVGLLSGQATAGDAMIAVTSNTGGVSSPCGGSTYSWCAITPSLTQQPGAFYCASDYVCAAGLTTTTSFGTGGNGPYTLTYAGSITANQAGSIGSVYTIVNNCVATGSGPNAPGTLVTSSPSSTVLPGTCGSTSTNYFFGPLTSTNLATPVSVASGQLIQIQVVISFS